MNNWEEIKLGINVEGKSHDDGKVYFNKKTIMIKENRNNLMVLMPRIARIQSSCESFVARVGCRRLAKRLSTNR